ncbi:MAG: hypothetical protein A2Z34_06560 [Planctomycetes bacterium RBG_16_59_8]|nr:MAG: hypothetical protein A2Z34_06560 [Planctomycetes bacterium RBG_16_59_8]
MAKRTKPITADPEGFTMTPMIDIVFQLIIFFMLISDLSSRQLAALVLPEATKVVIEQKQSPDIVVVNVKNDGRYLVSGDEYTREALKGFFADRKMMRELQDPANPAFVTYPLVIRADGAAPYEHVQWLLMAAARFGGIVKLQIVAEKPVSSQ